MRLIIRLQINNDINTTRILLEPLVICLPQGTDFQIFIFHKRQIKCKVGHNNYYLLCDHDLLT